MMSASSAVMGMQVGAGVAGAFGAINQASAEAADIRVAQTQNKIATARDTRDTTRERQRDMARARAVSALTGNRSFGVSQAIAEEYGRALFRIQADSDVTDETLNVRRKNIQKAGRLQAFNSLLGAGAGVASTYGQAQAQSEMIKLQQQRTNPMPRPRMRPR